MPRPFDRAERRQVLALARQYRRDGYQVTMPDSGENVPHFLGAYVPDLIAESETDKVVIEVRQASCVRGSDDLVELAECVSRQRGWRLELVTVPGDRSSPSAVRGLTTRDGDVRKLLGGGFVVPAFIFAYTALESIAVAIADHHKLKTRGRSPSWIVRDLAGLGLIAAEDYNAFVRLSAKRDAVFHQSEMFAAPTGTDVRTLVRLGEHLRTALDVVEAA